MFLFTHIIFVDMKISLPVLLQGSYMGEETRKLNCWEFQGCGREPGGLNASTCGVCPAAMESRLDGVHGGSNAGRACWVVAGTLCKGDTDGTFAKKYRVCSLCEFYLLVREEEVHRDIVPTFALLEILDGK